VPRTLYRAGEMSIGRNALREGNKLTIAAAAEVPTVTPAPVILPRAEKQ